MCPERPFIINLSTVDNHCCLYIRDAKNKDDGFIELSLKRAIYVISDQSILVLKLNFMIEKLIQVNLPMSPHCCNNHTHVNEKMSLMNRDQLQYYGCVFLHTRRLKMRVYL